MTKRKFPLFALHPARMTPTERARGRFLRAPDHDAGSGGGGEKTFTQADIDALKASVDRLEAKNAELVGDLRKARKSSEIKPEDLAAAEDRADKAEQRAADAEKQVKTLTTERDKAIKALETEQGFTQKLIIQDGLKSALIANGVKDEDFLDTLSAKFASGATIKVDGDQRIAMIGDKALTDHIKEWAGSDAGKKFVAAPVNGGGGAPGGKGGEGGKSMSSQDFNALDAKGRADFMAGGGKIVDAAA